MSDPKVSFDEFISPEAELKTCNNVEGSYIELAADTAESFVEAGAVTETVYVSDTMPEGYTMVIGEDGQQYVTIVQGPML